VRLGGVVQSVHANEEDHTKCRRAHRMIGELSDGERQKIMLARSGAAARSDDPRRDHGLSRFASTGGDHGILRRLAHDRGKAILLSTNDLELALSTADKIWLLPKGGALVTGAPEDLVLRGVFATAFASEGARFDEESGSFLTSGSFHSEIELVGEGTRTMWTRRALKRSGYRLTRGSQSCVLRVTVTGQQGKPVWSLSQDGSIGDAVASRTCSPH
jgi:iron complex transport system ATP-binding protein